jgi:hypothetical protein
LRDIALPALVTNGHEEAHMKILSPQTIRYLEPVADYRGRANGVRAGASHDTA